MTAKLNWVKEAFSREIIITDKDRPVGRMHRNLMERDVEATLFDTHIKFDIIGFLVQSVTIHDLTAGGQVIGTLTFYFGKRAELNLTNGDRYIWKRHNLLMRNWDMIRERNAGDEQEIVNYHLTRQFLSDHGDISIEAEVPQANVVVLTGLFVRNYFKRRRRAAAAVAGGA